MKNFGGNVRFKPKRVLMPADEREVLSCLDEYRGRRIRAIGSLHSWSEAAACDDIVLNLERLNGVRVTAEADGTKCAEIEAGCTIKCALACLHVSGGYTLPTVGMSDQQTIAGAIATATHGSGLGSLSAYVSSVRVAAYSPETGKASIYEWGGGDDLLAARCGLGCTGIVLSLRIRVIADYLLEEQTQLYEGIDDTDRAIHHILDRAKDYPRQQFYLIPWSWTWFAQHRRKLPPGYIVRPWVIDRLRRIPVSWKWFVKLRRKLELRWARRPGFKAFLRRQLRFVGIDVLFNGALKVASGVLRWSSAVHFLHRRVFPAITRSSPCGVERSRHMLMMRHDLYRHVEMELFVREASVANAAAFIKWVLRICGGESLPMPQTLADDFIGLDLRRLKELQGHYVHDHAITFRSVLRDETLISMTSVIQDEKPAPEASAETVDVWYAISLVTYQRDLTPFMSMAEFVAKAMASAYKARPHWGKVCPLNGAEIAPLYAESQLSRFKASCKRVDPEGAFVSEFAMRVLGLREPATSDVAPAIHLHGGAALVGS